MPAPVASSASASTASKPVTSHTRGSATHAKKTRVVRRRGRAKRDMDSDDEIERELRTDSESEDDLSSIDSSSDSDTEPASEDVMPNHHPRVVTPSTSQSPEETASQAKPVQVVNGHDSSFFASSGNWSEMVADEADHGSAGLPVIDFSELDNQALPVPAQSRKPKKPKKQNRRLSAASLPRSSPDLSRTAVNAEPQEELEEAADTPSETPRRPPGSRRPPGQTARQAYQQRLEADPSYVPTVGEFWGHDDRLLDKDLRSLSGWWRGRWQGGPRGRGFDRGFIRGRGGFLGSSGPRRPAEDVEEEREVQPVDRAWTHDGFEEMKRNEDHRRSFQQPRQQSPSQAPLRGLDSARGRGASFAGRGGRGGRGGFSPSFRSHRAPLPDPGRVWFIKKPEHMWTKQQESFLYQDPNLKPRAGNAGFVRVKLPSQKTPAVRVPIQPAPLASTSKLSFSDASPGSDDGDRALIVRLPKAQPKEEIPEKVSPEVATATVEPSTEPSIDEVFTVRPRLVSPKPIPLPEHPANDSVPASLPNGTHTVSSSVSSIDPVIQQKLEQVSIEPQRSDPVRWIQTEEAVLRHPTGAAPEEPPVSEEVISLQTNFSPSQGSPAYGSPYSYAPSLPPGVALSPAGMAYEVATGRPVYLPPPTMYTPPPPPMMHPVPYVPGHVHHRSTVSPSEYIPTGTPPMNGFTDYAPAPPLFSFPRQTSRVEIRAPHEASANKASTSSSELRSTAAAFQPSKSEGAAEYFPSVPSEAQYASEADFAGEGQQMGYVPYGQYYYPDAYGYNPYMDMSQVAPYEMYPPEHNIPHGTVYYH